MKASKIVLTVVSILAIVLLVSTILYRAELATAKAGLITGSTINGLNTTHLNGVIDELKSNPKSGQVTFYSSSWWQTGMRTFTSFTGYKIDGKMKHQRDRNFVLLGDEGMELSGTDAAPGAVEELMYAVATCISAAANANASLMGVRLTKFEVDLECDLDLHGLFALNVNTRPGINNMRANIRIAGNADDETLKKIAMLGYQYSPVSETVRNGISFTPNITVTN